MGAGDYDGDARADILWRNTVVGGRLGVADERDTKL